MILITIIAVLFTILSSIAIVVLGVGKIIHHFVDRNYSGYCCAWVIVAWLSVSIPVCFVAASYVISFLI